MKEGTDALLKFRQLQRRLGLPLWQARGLLDTLWAFTFRNAPEGDIGRHTNEMIALGLEWTDDPDKLIDALVETKWLDRDPEFGLIVHDWDHHCEERVRKKLQRAGREFVQDRIRRRNARHLNDGVLADLAGSRPPPRPAPSPTPPPVNAPESAETKAAADVGPAADSVATQSGRRVDFLALPVPVPHPAAASAPSARAGPTVTPDAKPGGGGGKAPDPPDPGPPRHDVAASRQLLAGLASGQTRGELARMHPPEVIAEALARARRRRGVDPWAITVANLRDPEVLADIRAELRRRAQRSDQAARQRAASSEAAAARQRELEAAERAAEAERREIGRIDDDRLGIVVDEVLRGIDGLNRRRLERKRTALGPRMVALDALVRPLVLERVRRAS